MICSFDVPPDCNSQDVSNWSTGLSVVFGLESSDSGCNVNSHNIGVVQQGVDCVGLEVGVLELGNDVFNIVNGLGNGISALFWALV